MIMANNSGMEHALRNVAARWFVKTGTPCPNCGAEMVQPAHAIDHDTGKRIQPMCPKCYYSVAKGRTVDSSNSGAASSAELELSARRLDAVRYMANYSLYSNTETAKYTMDMWQADTLERQKALLSANRALAAIEKGVVIHASYFGSTGTGKTHIANAIMRAAVPRTNYNARVMFLDWRQYIDDTKAAMNGGDADRQFVAEYMRHAREADLVVMDDFGSERDTDFARDQADQFWRAREDKTVIMTTNLTPELLAKRYDARTISRIRKHASGYGLRMTGEDMRATAQEE